MSVKKKLAIIASRFPYPLNKGDKLRLFHQIKYLAQYFEIHLHAINEENIKPDEQKTVMDLCHSTTLYNLNVLQKVVGLSKSLYNGEPLQVGYFYSKKIVREIQKNLKRQKIDAVYCQLSRTAVYGLTFKGPVIIDFQDCFSKNYERAFQHASGIKKWFYKREWKAMLSFETKMNDDFIGKTIISEFDKKSLPFDAKNITVVPNGVDPEYYKHQNVAKEFDILFSGNLNYQPNVDAAIDIIEKLAPVLIKEIPDIKIGIAGKSTNKKILQAGNKNIQIVTEVADMRAMYAKTKIFIAPLFTGAGLQNKLLEAMSMGIPCIASQVTNLSLKATVNEEILVASNIEEFCEATLALLFNTKKQDELALKGQTYIHNKYSWELANEKLKNLLENYL